MSSDPHYPDPKETAFLQDMRAKLENRKFLYYYEADLLLRCCHKLLQDTHWLKGEAQAQLAATLALALSSDEEHPNE